MDAPCWSWNCSPLALPCTCSAVWDQIISEYFRKFRIRFFAWTASAGWPFTDTSHVPGVPPYRVRLPVLENVNSGEKRAGPRGIPEAELIRPGRSFLASFNLGNVPHKDALGTSAGTIPSASSTELKTRRPSSWRPQYRATHLPSAPQCIAPNIRPSSVTWMDRSRPLLSSTATAFCITSSFWHSSQKRRCLHSAMGRSELQNTRSDVEGTSR